VAVLGPGQGRHKPSVLLQASQFRGHPRFFAKITEISDSFAFPNFTKVSIFTAFMECPKIKSASASGGASSQAP